MHSHFESIEKLLSVCTSVIVGKETAVKQAACCLFAGGHLLIEDAPGVGKTTLTKCLAKALDFRISRIQCTADLLPSDIIGVSIYDQDKKAFVFHEGPLFAPFVMAEELNRATPKAQSAFLQAMEEQHVSVDGVNYPLPSPFFVIGTQNPYTHAGTFPLPESQLDRFLMKISIGQLDRSSERSILQGQSPQERLNEIKPVMNAKELIEILQFVKQVRIKEDVLDILQNLVQKSRDLGAGLSTRASLGFLQAAKSWACLHGRDFVIPEDINAVSYPVMQHRLSQKTEGDDEQKQLYETIIAAI